LNGEAALTLRVTGVRSQNPRGFGGAIFTGVPIDPTGTVLDACTYIVVKANRATLGATQVERGQWWSVRGPIVERRSVVDGYQVLEQQVDAEAAHLAMPSGEHIVSYIAGNAAFEGLGSVKARRLWERFGERLYGLLDTGDASTLAEVLTPDISQRLVEAWAQQGHSRVLQWLQAQGFDVRLGRKVIRFFGADAQTRIEEDPYRLLSFEGQWAAVDRMARERFGVALTDPRRVRGAVEEACYRIFASGHTAMVSADLSDAVVPLLGKPPAGIRWRDQLATAITAAVSNGSVVQTSHGLQPLGALVMERQVAQAIQQRLKDGDIELLTPDEVERAIEQGEAEAGIELNPEQCNAVRLAARHAFVSITGGAGVGKTTVLRALYRIYDATGTKVLQVALAGRAAKRMQEATGRPALTIASFLKSVTEATFEGPTVLVLDEASMVDVISMSRLCQVLPQHVRLVLVGDPHQLMPVGPGLVLHCLTGQPKVPGVELLTVKRYGGDIAKAAADIRAGRWPALSDDETAPIAFLPCEERLMADLVVDLYALDPVNTQVLAPLRNSLAGTKNLNLRCQERFTKGAPSVSRWNVEFNQPELCGLNLGDVVLCTRNLWDKGLQNGSLGRVVEVEPASAQLPTEDEPVLAWVDWDDGVRRALTTDMLEDVELGYAVTVHKAQGSQWPRVIVPLTDSRLLDRTLVYTAVTRAQRQVILVGDAEAARRAVQAPPRVHTRKVALDLALKRYMAAPELA
jgi:exodeoxyribonuclease V alpha subunit